MLRSATRRTLLATTAALAMAPRCAAATRALAVELWKIRGCACCSAWARLLEADGFAVTTHEVDDLGPIRVANRVPEDLAGCHTATVAGYVVEGHVPLADLRRLLARRPTLVGLAVPGMPMGSPGMEMPGMTAEPFQVIAFSADGSRKRFS